jgi:hypothetical protein
VELRLDVGGEGAGLGEQVEARVDRAGGRVRGAVQTEEGHGPVAHEVVDLAAVPLDDAVDAQEEAVETWITS